LEARNTLPRTNEHALLITHSSCTRWSLSFYSEGAAGKVQVTRAPKQVVWSESNPKNHSQTAAGERGIAQQYPLPFFPEESNHDQIECMHSRELRAASARATCVRGGNKRVAQSMFGDSSGSIFV